jgi:hypothetical protein
MNENTTQKKKRGPIERSPSYPAIGLKDAIEKAMVLKRAESGGKIYFPYQSALAHWGYKPKSSWGLLMLAALKKFGLIEDQGAKEERQIKLTELAQNILFIQENGQEDTKEYIKSIQEAALNPDIHAELWEKYGEDLPSDFSFKSYLVREREQKFNEKSANDFISQYKDTIAFAKLTGSDMMFGDDGDKLEDQTEDPPMPETHTNPSAYTPPPPSPPGEPAQMFDMTVPLFNNKIATMRLPRQLSQVEWDLMMAMLNAAKPALVPDAPKTGKNSGEKSENE